MDSVVINTAAPARIRMVRENPPALSRHMIDLLEADAGRPSTGARVMDLYCKDW